MNLIEAYKKAKVGETISNPDVVYEAWYIKTDQDSKFNHWVTENMTTSGLLSDNWQIERKPLVWEGECEWIDLYCDSVGEMVYYAIPIGVNEEIKKLFLGKRTKIRIEEIIE